MMNVAVLSLYLLATLFTPHVYPGQDVTIKIVAPGTHLELSGNCTYFAKNGSQSLYAEKPGNYTIVVPITCKPGTVTVKVKRGEFSEKYDFEILEPTKSYLVNYSLKLQEDKKALETQVKMLTDKVKELVKKIEEYKSEIQKLNAQIDDLKADKEKLQNQINKLNAKIQELNSIIDEKNKIVQSLRKQLNNLRGENYKLKIASLFIISLFFGSYAAVIMRRKGY